MSTCYGTDDGWADDIPSELPADSSDFYWQPPDPEIPTTESSKP
jgi:hypothetical protein